MQFISSFLDARTTRKYVDINSSAIRLPAEYLIVFIIALFFMCLGIDMVHWFIIPVVICGLLVTPDMLKWFGGEYDAFDPKGLFALAAFYVLFISPLLWVATNAQMLYVINPPDWRPWLGMMAIVNILGLLAYLAGQRFGYITGKSSKEFWDISVESMSLVLPVFLLITFLGALYFYFSMGGISGAVITGSQTLMKEAFAGKGWIIMIGRSFPMVILILATALKLRNEKEYSISIILIFLFAFAALQFFFDGLRGSRSSVVYSLFIAAGTVHYLWKPLSRKLIIAGLVVILIFAFFYGFYKTVGIEALDLLRGRTTVQEMEQRTGRSVGFFFLEDLTRAQVQSFLLYRLVERPGEYDPRWGATYIGDIAVLVPKTVWPNRPPTKVEAGTELLRGKDSYYPGQYQASRIYGLGGEAILNFSIWGVPLAYLLWGFLVGRFRHWVKSLRKNDIRFMLVPLCTLLLLLMFISDLDNVVTNSFFHGFILTAVILLIAKRRIVSKELNSEVDSN